jgi:hypothetical protein
MKRRFIVLSIILAMVVITWQHGKNRALTQLLENSRVQDAIHVDRIFDLEQENADLMEYIMELETNNSILGSCCANGGLDADTTLID